MVLNFIWNKVRSEKKKRLLTVDEAWILMKYEDSAQFLFSIAKRARKYYLGLTTISQDVEDFLGSPYGRAIISNSSLNFLLKQHPAVVDKVARVFNLTQAEKYFLLNSEVGEGLFFAGLNHVAVQVVASYQEDLLINTNPAEEE
jgi:type IV secretory pathway VirB4 component